MSIELRDFDPRDSRVVGEAASAACRLCVVQGMTGQEAYTTGDSAATYAAELTLAALRKMGIISDEGLDSELFTETIKGMLDAGRIPELEAIRNAQE